jgi:uncharacterized protein (DUF4415 family)
MNESDRDVEMRDEYDFSEARRGAVMPLAPGKTRITIRLDNDILQWFRAQVHRQGGGNYQTLINDALRDYIRRTQGDARHLASVCTAEHLPGVTSYSSEPLSPQFIEIVRQLIREELERVK